MTEAADMIRQLGMQAHPEGGWYVETFRAPSVDGERAAATVIYFLLEHGQRSHWHQVDADEIWLWHEGAPLRLAISDDGQTERLIALGPDWRAGQQFQAVVPKNAWQSAETSGDWTLVSCVVAPAFAFSGFRLAPPDWRPGKGG